MMMMEMWISSSTSDSISPTMAYTTLMMKLQTAPVWVGKASSKASSQ